MTDESPCNCEQSLQLTAEVAALKQELLNHQNGLAHQLLQNEIKSLREKNDGLRSTVDSLKESLARARDQKLEDAHGQSKLLERANDAERDHAALIAMFHDGLDSLIGYAIKNYRDEDMTDDIKAEYEP